MPALKDMPWKEFGGVVVYDIDTEMNAHGVHPKHIKYGENKKTEIRWEYSKCEIPPDYNLLMWRPWATDF